MTLVEAVAGILFFIGFGLAVRSRMARLVLAALIVTTLGSAQAQISQLMTEQWSGWENIGGVVNKSPGCVASMANRVDCFSAQSGGVLGWRRWNGSSWVNWTTLNGVATDSFFSSRTECVSWGADHVDCFVRRDTDKALFYRTFDGNYVSGWQALGGALQSDPSCIVTGPRQLACFARFADNHLHEISFDGDIWSDWVDRGGQIMADTKPSCFVFRGETDCVAPTNTGALQRFRILGGGLATMDKPQIGNAVQAPAAGADPSFRCVVSPGANPQDSRIQCFAPEFAPGPMLGRWDFDGNSWGISDMGAIPQGASYDWDCVAGADERVDCVDMIVQGTATGFGGITKTGVMLRHIKLDYLPSANWETPTMTAMGAPFAAFVRCVSWAPQRLDCFAAGGELANAPMWHAWLSLRPVILHRPDTVPHH